MERLKRSNRIVRRAGQSLVEILIALAVGGMLIGSAATLMAVVLRAQSQDVYVRTASALNDELMGKFAQYAERQWYCPTTPTECGVYNLAKGQDPSKNHSLVFTNGQFRPAGPNYSDSININNVTYLRYFRVMNVCRNGGDISGLTDVGGTTTDCNEFGGAEDPSTQYVSVCTDWTYQNGGAGNFCVNRYFVRNRVALFHQTDWSGGSGQNGLWTAENKFDTSSNIDYGTAGEIKLTP